MILPFQSASKLAWKGELFLHYRRQPDYILKERTQGINFSCLMHRPDGFCVLAAQPRTENIQLLAVHELNVLQNSFSRSFLIEIEAMNRETG